MLLRKVLLLWYSLLKIQKTIIILQAKNGQEIHLKNTRPDISEETIITEMGIIGPLEPRIAYCLTKFTLHYRFKEIENKEKDTVVKNEEQMDQNQDFNYDISDKN